jgi:hypothetical protein
MIATDSRKSQRDQQACGLARIERTRKNTAKIDDQVRTGGANIGQHGVERGEVAVNVG